jgi:exodeoxyribonuclease VII large subunit
MERTILSLYDLNKNIQEVIRTSLSDTYWVKTEIAQLKENYSGHCYLEIIEKDTESDRIIAQAKATIWANTYRILKPYFETTTNRKLTEGLKILICVKVEYHALYGLSLNVTDIDPAFTVGDLAIKKAEIIRRLKEEGVFDMNKQIKFPLVPQRIAVISSETAAGFTDFTNHLDNNPFHYHFSVKLFPSTMQGNNAEESIIESLEKINDSLEQFDAVAIIRGGGSQTDLSCFDNYLLASHVAQFPLPVLTGIGHEQDESITDLVAHLRLKTPTAVADHLIDCFQNVDLALDDYNLHLSEIVGNIISDQNIKLEQFVYRLPVAVNDFLKQEDKVINSVLIRTLKANEKRIRKEEYLHHKFELMASSGTKYFINKLNSLLDQKTGFMKNIVSAKVQMQYALLDKYRNLADYSDPENILKRGFSITYHKGKLVTDSESLLETDIIETRLKKGTVNSEVKNVKK